LPENCRLFLAVPADAKDAMAEQLMWEGRLSVAACRLAAIQVAPVSDPGKLRETVAKLEQTIQPSVGIYQDAIAQGPSQIRILAEYGLGHAYTELMIRPRAATPTGGDIMKNLALADRYLALHHTLEPLLASERDRAADAFAEATRLGDSD